MEDQEAISADYVLSLFQSLNENISLMKEQVIANTEKLNTLYNNSLELHNTIQSSYSSCYLNDSSVFNTKEVLNQSILAKEREIQNLQKEIKLLLSQLNDNSEMIKVLSVDHISIEKEQESCDQLQSEIYDLQKEIVVKDGAILQQQLENTKLQIESSKLMGDLAEALLEDEQNASLEENSCNMLSKGSSYS